MRKLISIVVVAAVCGGPFEAANAAGSSDFDAQEIQTAIESWVNEARKNAEPPDPPGFEGGFAKNH